MNWVVSRGGLRGSCILKSQGTGVSAPQIRGWRADCDKLVLKMLKVLKIPQTLLTKLLVQGSKRVIPLSQLGFVIVRGQEVTGEEKMTGKPCMPEVCQNG